MKKPQWVLDKERIQNEPEEKLIFVGELGAAGVVDGKLPNGDTYEWYKRRDKMGKKKWKSRR